METKTTTKNTEITKVEYHNVKNTPFTAVKHNNKYIILLGNTAVVKNNFDTLKQVEEYIRRKPYELLTNMMCVIANKVNEFNKLENHEKKE